MKFVLSLVSCVVVTSVSLAASLSAQAPAMPGTGEYSVQMFTGGTQRVNLAVFPPTTYADGSPIPDGTPVAIRIYRSNDNGASYGTRVTLLSGGKGRVGQGAAGSRKKPWIDLTAEVPVDSKSPYTVYLAATAVVAESESAATASNLTFTYYPDLVRYGSPADAPGSAFGSGGSGNQSGSGSLAGSWDLDGNGTLTIKHDGRRVTGSLSAPGITGSSIRGTYDSGKYDLQIRLEGGGEVLECRVEARVDNQTVKAVLELNGERMPFELGIRGNRLVAKT